MPALAVLAALAVALFAVVQSASSQANTLQLSLRWIPQGETAAVTESDNVVKAGTSFQIFANVADDGDADNVAAATYLVGTNYVVANTGGIVVQSVTGPTVALSEGAVGAAQIGNLIIPAGTANGKYTISATAGTHFGSLTVTVGDDGSPIGSSTVSLANVGADGVAVDTGGDPDKASKRMGEAIAVRVNVLNTLGNKPNSHEVDSVLLFAPTAVVDEDRGNAINSTVINNSGSAASAGVTNVFYVSKDDAGTVDVYAVVIGSGGTATSEALTLTFTGNADTIALSDVSSPLPSSSTPDDTGTADTDETAGTATLKITAVDKSDNKAVLDAVDGEVAGLSITFKDADDKTVSTIAAALTQAIPAGQTTCDDTATPSTCDSTTVVATLTSTNAEVGTYMMEAKFNDKDAVTTEVVVSGKPASIELESSHETVELGNIVTVTATVTDKDGHAVTNENSITFVAVGSLELTALDPINPNTDHGEAKIRYVVTKGSGNATIIVSDAAEDGTADAVIAISTIAEEPEAMPEEEASVACLSNLAGFATWACGVESSASEIFGLVSGRGATALHLWNGSAWVRYSVVDGTMVPGSSDFMVAENDILYISN